MLIVIVALAIGWYVDRSRLPEGVALPEDPLFSAIEQRLGRPDALTGSGRAFLHYDLHNGDRLTLAVSGNQIIGAQHDHKPK
ncbi:hypothetical protein [Rubripirellula tenax]|nr:hypothetical protein [Rubripirellula tenax]